MPEKKKQIWEKNKQQKKRKESGPLQFLKRARTRGIASVDQCAVSLVTPLTSPQLADHWGLVDLTTYKNVYQSTV